MKKGNRQSLIYLGITILLIVVFSTTISAQCSICRAVLQSNLESGQNALGRGINDGIIYLMCIPYLVAGFAGFFLYRHYKKHNGSTTA